jgi:NAD(P)H-flavin reductase
MTTPQQFTAKLEDKTIHNEKFVQYRFELVKPHTMEFAAGQYVSVKVDEKGIRRSYSICSSPAVTHGFELLIDTSPNGIGTNFFKNLEFGDQVELMGPLGVFTLAAENSVAESSEAAQNSESVVLVGTGSGIAPLRSMVLELLQVNQDQRQIHLHWGVRYAHNLFWLDEWQELEESFPNFHFHPVISRPIPDWILCRGRVTDCLSLHDLPSNASYYLCGGQAMTTDVTALLEKREISAAQVHHEKFF